MTTSSTQPLISFTEEQKTILKHPPTEHGRILAGPGTGKSTTAAALAQKLAARDPIPRVRFLTFTRAATAELSKKISAQTGNTESASTIHSFSMSILVRNPGCAIFPHPLRIADDYEESVLIRPHLALKLGVGTRVVDKLINEMSAKWESLSETPNEEIEPEQRARFLGMWMEHRHVFGYTLLAELPDLFRQAMRDHDDLLGLDYDLLIVDEYQDLNACDLEVLQRLAQKGIRILAIGDDDQSIYSIRKAAPTGIRRFPLDYEIRPQFDYQLSVCQRSPRTIFNWAQFVIQGLPDRDKTRPLPTFSKDAPEGTCALLHFTDDDNEASGVSSIITWLHAKKNIPLSEILVLYRTKNFGSSFTDKVAQILSGKIEINRPDRIHEVLSDQNNRLLLANLHLIDFPTDSLAWWTLIKSCRGIGNAFVDFLYDKAVALNTSFGEALDREAQNSFSTWPATLSRQVQLALSVWTETRKRLEILPEKEGNVRWSKWILDNTENGLLPDCTSEFKELLIGVDGLIEEDEQDLGRFLSQIQPKGKDLYQSKSTGVRFMTMTGSKGLTAQATIIVGVDNDLIPHPRGDVNEEHRLLYVAMTRPKEYLFMTWVTRRTGYVVHSGRENYGRRQYSEFLRGGPVESEDGERYIQRLLNS